MQRKQKDVNQASVNDQLRTWAVTTSLEKRERETWAVAVDFNSEKSQLSQRPLIFLGS